MSSAYHPESDGQTEVVNRCVETYLRCFTSERPKEWGKWLLWAEYCYNTGFHSATGATPFEVVYGRSPPRITQFLPGEIKVQAVADMLKDRDTILSQLRFHLERAQQRMIREANKHRRPVEYAVGDMVYLKFRPYRQSSLYGVRNKKLTPHFFSPFEVEARVGAVAYRLKLPPPTQVHPVFHVSLLKSAVGSAVVELKLPVELLQVEPPFVPEKVLSQRMENQGGQSVRQVLIKWKHLGDEEATWMNEEDMLG